MLNLHPSLDMSLKWCSPGGKAKPLKAPKKAQKELDEDDLAFLEKQRAGEFVIVG